MLVTGATGFLGQRLVEVLIESGYWVRGLDRRLSGIQRINATGAEVVYGDIGDAASLQSAFKDIDVVVHAAADTSGIEEETRRTTIEGTKNVLDLCEVFGIKKLIHISSLNVYGTAGYRDNDVLTEESSLEPYPEKRGFYTLGKVEAEKMVKEAIKKGAFSIVCLRPGTIFGPGGQIYTPMMGFSFGRKLFAIIGMGGFLLPMVYIDNLVDAIVTVIRRREADNKVFNVVDPDCLRKKEYVKRILKPLYPRALFIFIPYGLICVAVWLQEKLSKVLGRKPKLTCYRLASSQKNVLYDSTGIMKTLEWKPPYSMDSAVEAVVAHERKRKNLRQD